MKSIKFVLPMLSILISLLLTSCNKNVEMTPSVKPEISTEMRQPLTLEEAHKMGIYDDSSQDTEEYFEDVKLPLDLNTRAGSVSISAVTTTDTLDSSEDGYFDLCGKFQGYPRLSAETEYKIKGTGFGATQGSSSVKIKLKSGLHTITTISSWSDTEIVLKTNNSSPLIPRDVKQETATFSVTVGTNTASKSIKVVGDLSYTAKSCDPRSLNMFVFGQAWWNVATERLKLNLDPFCFGGIVIDEEETSKFVRGIPWNYMPEKGDVLYRMKSGDGVTGAVSVTAEDAMQQKGVAVVTDISTPDANGVRIVTVTEMNRKCTSALEKKKYKYILGLFIPKTGELRFVQYMR